MWGRRGCSISEEMLDGLHANHHAAVAEAARKIKEADVLLLCTGAGFSADSGLAVYADVARVPAYARRHLKYHDICQPSWLKEEPETFWGFWGQCFNDYRSTAPHQGYEVISGWVERFRHSSFADAVRERYNNHYRKCENSEVPYGVFDSPGAFFAFTSNVDAHHFDWFLASEIRECHGNVELYQCASRRCKRHIWRAPLNFRFHVDKATMLARDGLPAKSTACAVPCTACGGNGYLLREACPLCDGAGVLHEEEEDENNLPGMPAESVPRVGQVRGGGRPTALRYMPGPNIDAQATGFVQNHPVCPSCQGPARPAILMFGDFAWQDLNEQEQRWKAWSAAVKDEIASRKGDVKAVILELGAGCNVPTVRMTSEYKLRAWRSVGADVCLVRVNPELPLGDHPPFSPGCKDSDAVVSILARGLPTIQQIDAVMLGESGAAISRDDAMGSPCANPPPSGVEPEGWDDITAGFLNRAQGRQAISIDDAYHVIVKDVEKDDYSPEVFCSDVRTFKKMAGRDVLVEDELTLPEVRQFLEMFT